MDTDLTGGVDKMDLTGSMDIDLTGGVDKMDLTSTVNRMDLTGNVDIDGLDWLCLDIDGLHQ